MKIFHKPLESYKDPPKILEKIFEDDEEEIALIYPKESAALMLTLYGQEIVYEDIYEHVEKTLEKELEVKWLPSVDKLSEALDELVEKGYVDEIDNAPKSCSYKLSDKGEDLVISITEKANKTRLAMGIDPVKL